MPTKLTEHFTLDELIFSSTAERMRIDNEPYGEQAENLKIVAEGLEKVRTLLLSNPMHIDSGFRCYALNRAVGGSMLSAHCNGLAADFTCSGFGTPLDICKAILASDIVFDQLIQEGTWVHISFSPLLRREVLTAHFYQGGVKYTEGLT